ncbi:MAG: Crp/Fnr family transcriptional regulator [Flavobacteriales bacterium]|nr:Crp/Fnr family transcriptional regulator [Flavobacteriia bacterium]NCP05021.1 Crp/Fnr family transcriptional regulator [Flavobacteriales bacterium]PIV94231.1 MAG: Crp/Fnr family transcriptional regulator [Flavobacteriaceae bacterium CG17_big_fil_post_rev_8_21_14_2_50_33_15]PIY10724.1 MAG: Crp/Fnr family transcriptional regulator [Flavobacteriaceae bacterium CG_4_10_14_3_um_filter_33_47]PJB19406.1 MAG: Crp/Fnr family transcriptional regulator [Flavobacteriaceae bacterium CG_4_9_14_3_um_filter
MEIDKKILSFLKPELVDLILKESSIRMIPKGTEILRQQQYVKVLPIVLKGLVKVYSRFDEKELLLYYIEPLQSCVMSFYAALKNTPSRVFAQTEENSKVILIPVQYLPIWLKKYPEFNELFFNQYNLRYSELLDTISHLLLDKMDKRLYDHLKRKTELISNTSIKISHTQLANELGTAREVISRIMKKLENDGKVEQNSGRIKIIG